MRVIPIESKQVGYVEYDAERSCLIAHFTTGEVKAYDVSHEDYAVLCASANKYDCFVRMTLSRVEHLAADAGSAAIRDTRRTGERSARIAGAGGAGAFGMRSASGQRAGVQAAEDTKLI